MASVYDGGASFRIGKLYVSDTDVVENLNSQKLQGKVPADFVQTGSNSGISQSGKTISMAGETINLDTASEIKIGSVIIKSSPDGNGILIGI